MTASVRHLRNGAICLLVVCVVAVAGYMAAGWTLLESAYMAVITVFTVGYGETLPIDTPGLRIFTMLFVVLGCTSYLYIGGALVQFLVEGQIEAAVGNRRMSKSIHDLKGHTIICGYGRVGRMLAGDLHRAGHPFVVLDLDPQRVKMMRDEGYLCAEGDATREAALLDAGIAGAAKIAVVLPNDAANVFITLSARNLNHTLTIIARGVAPSTEGKLLQAGADRVVLPEHIGAERIASLILRPTARALFTASPQLGQIEADLAECGLQVEEFSVPANSNLVGLTLADLETKGSSAFLIVSIVREDGTVVDRPTLGTAIQTGDTLISLCHKGDSPEFARIFKLRRQLQYRGATIG